MSVLDNRYYKYFKRNFTVTFNRKFRRMFKDLFPDNWSIALFLLYMILFINQGLIVTSSQQLDKSYNYSTIIVVLLTEVTKLVVTILLYLKNERCGAILQTLREHARLCVYYMIPAFLYCCYNNLAFLNLSRYDPTTYFILLQLRVMITAVIFQVIFKKKLTLLQWVSLAILTIGCIVKNFSVPGQPSSLSHSFTVMTITSSGILWILFQVFCSCLAGVYNEKLLKVVGSNVDILAQNIFMCVDSVFFNVVALVTTEDMKTFFSSDSFLQILRLNVLMIIVNNAAIGIVTAFFLKNFNSIVKNYASALELIFTAILAWIIFGIEIGVWTVISIVLVVLASFLYLHNPVINRPLLSTSPDGGRSGSAQQTLLPTEWKNIPK